MMIELVIFFCTTTSVVVVVVKRFFMSFLSGDGLDFQVSHTHTSRHTEAAHKTGKCYTNTRATFPKQQIYVHIQRIGCAHCSVRQTDDT